MSSHAWSVVGDLASVQTLVGTVLGTVATVVCQNRTTSALLEQCKGALDDVKTRLNELSPDRRERIRLAAAQGKCASLEKLEHDLLRLLDERCELTERSEKSSYLERNLPLSQLRVDIDGLKDAIQDLREDTWNTTNFPSKEAKSLARARSLPTQCPSPTHSCSVTDVLGRCTSQTQRVPGPLEGHPMDVMHPPSAHIVERHGMV